MHAQVGQPLAALVSRATQAPAAPPVSVPVGSLGHFSLVRADASWSKRRRMGAVAYFARADILVWQVVPDSPHRTRDSPDRSRAVDAAAQPVWQWVARMWAYPISSDSMARTNFAVLVGVARE